MPTIPSQYPLFHEKSMREREIEGGRRGSRPGPEEVSAVESSTVVITHQQKYKPKHEDSFPWSMKPAKKHKSHFFSLLVGPYMNKTMSITSIDLVPVFIIKEGSYVLQSLCNRAPYLR